MLRCWSYKFFDGGDTVSEFVQAVAEALHLREERIEGLERPSARWPLWTFWAFRAAWAATPTLSGSGWPFFWRHL